MGQCTNCKARLTCGCQKRVSKTGIAGCANCINQLNAQQPQKTQAPKPNAPTNISATYKGPGTQI